MSINAFLNQRWNFRHRALNWHQAVLMTSQPLVEEKKVNAYYPLHIIDNLKQHCDDFIIEDGVMIMYAQPHQGVTSKREEASVLKCRKPVRMPNGRKISLFIMISAGESQNMQELREQIQIWLNDGNCCETLLQSANKPMLQARIQKSLNLH